MGDPDAGKSTLLAALAGTMGTKPGGTLTLDPIAFTPKRDGGPQGHNDFVAPLADATFALMEEVNNANWMRAGHAPELSKYTGGGSVMVTVSRKGEKGQSLRLRAMIIMTANHPPEFAVSNAAMQKRTRWLNVEKHTKMDRGLRGAFSADSPASRDLLRRLVEAAGANPPGSYTTDDPSGAPEAMAGGPPRRR